MKYTAADKNEFFTLSGLVTVRIKSRIAPLGYPTMTTGRFPCRSRIVFLVFQRVRLMSALSGGVLSHHRIGISRGLPLPSLIAAPGPPWMTPTVYGGVPYILGFFIDVSVYLRYQRGSMSLFS